MFKPVWSVMLTLAVWCACSGGPDDGPAPGGGDTTSSSSGGAVRTVGTGVLLYKGAGGGGHPAVYHPDDVETFYRARGFTVAQDTSLPSNVADENALVVLLNPREDLPAGEVSLLQTFLSRGGRVAVFMEHCKNGCYGSPDQLNALFQALGVNMVMHADGGTDTTTVETLSVTAVPPLTTGTEQLAVLYTASITTSGTAQVVARAGNGDVVMAYQALGLGSVVAVADTNPLGTARTDGDNPALLEALANRF
ncbi:MAG: hypothetical protein AB2A00_23680 [Myxococcota bacterium]